MNKVNILRLAFVIIFMGMAAGHAAPVQLVVTKKTTITVKAGQMLKILNIGHQSNVSLPPVFIVIPDPADKTKELEFEADAFSGPVIGPAKVRLYPIDAFEQYTRLYFCYEIVPYK